MLGPNAALVARLPYRADIGGFGFGGQFTPELNLVPYAEGFGLS
jgi:hypothetical protein